LNSLITTTTAARLGSYGEGSCAQNE
jgi:hypothetical protein